MVSGHGSPSLYSATRSSAPVNGDPVQAFSYSSASYHSSPPRYFSIDVECVAIGKQHNARAVGQIALVDEMERVILNLYVRPEVPVVSYLTPLTGLNRESLEGFGIPLSAALDTLRHHLPSDAILVGQSIRNDVEWLDLEEGIDFASMVDLAGLYKVWNTRYGSWTIFSLEHLANVILGIPPSGQPHNAVDDAVKSIKLFNYYRQFGQNLTIWEMKQRALLKTRAPMSFSRRFPRFEGVCMGNRKLCTCGAPFLG